MSTLFWKIFKLSPALLGVSLLFTGSAYAQESAPAQTVAINPSQAAAPSERAATASIQPQSIATQPTVSQQTPSDIQANPNGANKFLAQQVPASDNATSNPSEVLDQIQQYQPENSSTSADTADTIDQVTNVSQLSDVRPTDWAYEALRSLVERYGCIAGYPDGTFRGNRALSRYEFAAGVNACLQQI
ncbi:MAG TPA: iron uptake porin, partial [Waterburya sp.]